MMPPPTQRSTQTGFPLQTTNISLVFAPSLLVIQRLVLFLMLFGAIITTRGSTVCAANGGSYSRPACDEQHWNGSTYKERNWHFAIYRQY